MARENSFIFFGEVDNTPIVLFNDEMKSYRVTFTIKTVRRNGRADYPKISIYSLDEETAKEYVRTLQKEAFVLLRGTVTTKLIRKPVRCEVCGKVSGVSTLQTEVISYGKPLVLKEKFNPIDIAEFANTGNLIGTVCNEPQRRDNPDSGDSALQFQLAVNRRYRVNELEKAIRTDYPWIKTFGGMARECGRRLEIGSQIYLIGAFQTRDITRHAICSHCSGQLTFEERVSEVVPNGMEFLNNCLFEAKTDEKKSETIEGVFDETEQ